MNEKPQSFDSTDLTNMLSRLDLAGVTDAFTKMLNTYQIPNLDMKAMLDSQRKNLDALVTTNKLAYEGLNEIVNRQGELLRQTMEEVSVALQDLAKAGGPREAVNKQTELFQHALERALANMRELAKITTSYQMDAVNLINKRVADNLREIKDLVATTIKK